MKPELTTNIRWYLATETKPEDDVYDVVAFMKVGYITSLSVCQGHFNCSFENDIGSENEFIAGDDVLYWTHMPNQLTAAAIKYKKQHGKNE